MKLGLDYHGVIDANPELFSRKTKALVDTGIEVHILTGEEDTPALRTALAAHNIHYTHLFSIITDCERKGIPIVRDEKNRPWVDPTIWNTAKATYCAEMGIDLHMDNSKVYGKYFADTNTVYIRYQKEEPE